MIIDSVKSFNSSIVEYIGGINKNAMEQIKIFESICDKAKEILWSFISGGKNDFLYSVDLFDFETLTPIEQIFNSALLIYKYVTNESCYLDITPQYDIQIKDKTYRADFYCEALVFDGVEWLLDKKIIIECDGYESHHTKEQRNRDIYRENELKLNGYSVIRFTGSQIFNHPYECFEKALHFITSENKDCIQKAIDEVCKNG